MPRVEPPIGEVRRDRGFAIRAAQYIRRTMDIDLLVATDAENEQRVFAALATLPDNAVRELQPGELQQYSVTSVADEVVVDLMRSGGIEYAEEAKDVVTHRYRRRADPVRVAPPVVAYGGVDASR